MRDGLRRPRSRQSLLVSAALAVAVGSFLLLARGPSTRVVAADGEHLDPATLPDGRIVYAHPLSKGDPAAAVSLYVAASDGHDEQRITFGSAQDRSPLLLPDGRVAFRRHATPAGGSGALFVINPDGTGLQLLRRAAGGGSIDGGPWLNGKSLVFTELAANGGGRRRLSVPVAAPLSEPVVVAESAPSASPSDDTTTVPVLNLTSVVDNHKSTGTLLCLNVYNSTLPALAQAQAGTIRTVGILEADGRPLGDAPVESDGSFFVEVPADRPLRLELRSDDGAIALDDSAFWVRPNENRGCVGCHEDPELAPENKVVLALARGPTRLGAPTPATEGSERPH